MVKAEGYKKMEADFAQHRVKVQFDPKKTNPNALAKRINAKTPFQATVAEAS